MDKKEKVDVVFTNNFHNTKILINPTNIDGRFFLSYYQVNRCRRELCGDRECMCGGFLGERGRQDWKVIPCDLSGNKRYQVTKLYEIVRRTNE